MTKTLREKKVYIAPAHVERQRTAARNTGFLVLDLLEHALVRTEADR